MPKGDQKHRVMRKRTLDEPGYYAFASVVGQQRHFNVQTAKLLAAYGFEPLRLLDGQGRPQPPQLPSEEILEWIIEQSNCPMTQLRAFVDVGGDELPDQTPWGRIAAGLVSTTEASLRRWGDANHFTPQLLRNYCGPEGQALDVQAMVLSHESQPVEPGQLWEFIVAHPRGQQSYRPQTIGHRLAEAFQRSAGFRLTYHYAADLLRLIDGRQPAPAGEEEPPF
ncbi:hypothetical protein I2I05_18855 [Hymenobacter sp. BT683]|uniref:DUF4276 family protein n=1 Tax=Hymenobacter jeongseonensis TaxID=2791027 RepID=A0ABS0IM68_9BACT|nr:hypothetical protein [Hymenobacter jeongseonensis]MBF9239460.1 hypothetical protein [Hymenobacter jeongseonensis]